MITKEKIKIYKKYDGDVDMWARLSRKSERFMEDSDWSLIDSFIQDGRLINKGLASDIYASAFNDRMIGGCDSEETIVEIRNLISENNLPNKDNFLKRIFTAFTRKG